MFLPFFIQYFVDSLFSVILPIITFITSVHLADAHDFLSLILKLPVDLVEWVLALFVLNSLPFLLLISRSVFFKNKKETKGLLFFRKNPTVRPVLLMLSSYFVLYLIFFIKLSSVVKVDFYNFLTYPLNEYDFLIYSISENLNFIDFGKNFFYEVFGYTINYSERLFYFNNVSCNILNSITYFLSSILLYLFRFSPYFYNFFFNDDNSIDSFCFMANRLFFLDGVSLWLFWLSLTVSYVLSFSSNKKKYIGANHVFYKFRIYSNFMDLLILLLCVCFLVKDLFVFFVSFEAVLLPLFVYTILQGSRFNKILAVKYLVIYTVVGSIFLWFSVVFLVEISGVSNFDDVAWVVSNSLNSGTRKVIFLALFLGFAVKVPMVPFHHWLIIAHVEATTNGSIILAALLLKVGTYSLYRFVYVLFPLESHFFSNEILALALFGFSYSTILAVRELDLKRYIAYTSIAHMNFSLLGLFSCTEFGLLGYLHTTISHGIIATAMFYLVGHLYSVVKFRDTLRVFGVAQKFPKFSVFFFLFSMANMGLPLFSGFVGEFFIISSVVFINEVYAFFLCIGFFVSGIYNLFQINRVLFSDTPSSIQSKNNEDLDANSTVVLVILLFWTVIFGLFPDILLKTVDLGLFNKNIIILSIDFMFITIMILFSTLIALNWTSTFFKIIKKIIEKNKIKIKVLFFIFFLLILGITLFKINTPFALIVINLYHDVLDLLENILYFLKSTNYSIRFWFYVEFGIGSILFEEIDNVEWASVIKNELDADYFIPGDLATAYGKGYIMDMISSKINHGRELFFAGEKFVHFGTVPLSGYTSQPDVPFNFDRSYDLPYWKPKERRSKYLETYYEYSMYGIDFSRQNGITTLSADSLGDYFRFGKSIRYSLDSPGKNTITINSNPAMFEDFLNWRDSQLNFESGERFGKMVSFLEKQPYLLSNPKNYLSKNSSELIGNQLHFDDYSTGSDFEDTFVSDGHLQEKSIFDYTQVGYGTNIEISEMLPTIYDELSAIYQKAQSTFFNNSKESVNISDYEDINAAGKSSKRKHIFSSGNIFIDHYLEMLRNPAADFSYKNSTTMHYDSLDKFWDSRPSTSGWLEADIGNLSPVSPNRVTDLANTGEDSLEKSNGSLLFGKVFSFCFRHTRYFIEYAVDIIKNIPKLGYWSTIRKSITRVDDFYLFLKLDFESDQKEIFTLEQGSEYLELLGLKNDSDFTPDQISIIKNLNLGRAWAKNAYFVKNKYEVPLYLDIPIGGLVLSREGLKESLISNILSGNITKPQAMRTLMHFDIYFKNRNLEVFDICLDLLYLAGMLESEEYSSRVIHLSPEILVCISAVSGLLRLGSTAYNTLEHLLDILDNSEVWENRDSLVKDYEKKKVLDLQYSVKDSYYRGVNFLRSQKFYESVLAITKPDYSKSSLKKIYTDSGLGSVDSVVMDLGLIKPLWNYKFLLYDSAGRDFLLNIYNQNLKKESFSKIGTPSIYYELAGDFYKISKPQAFLFSIEDSDFFSNKINTPSIKTTYPFVNSPSLVVPEYSKKSSILSEVSLKKFADRFKNNNSLEVIESSFHFFSFKYTYLLLYKVFFGILSWFTNYFFLNSDDFDKLVQLYLDIDSAFLGEIDIINSLIFKNTVNTLFLDIKSSYYRISDLNYFDLVSSTVGESLSSNSKALEDFKSISIFYKAIPVFFTKNFLGVSWGELPEFGIFSDFVLYADLIMIIFYTHYFNPIYYSQLFREDFLFDIFNWFIVIVAEPLMTYLYEDIFDYLEKIKNIFFDNSLFFEWMDYKGKVDFFFNSRILSLPFWLFTSLVDYVWLFIEYLYVWNWAILKYYIFNNLDKVVLPVRNFIKSNMLGGDLANPFESALEAMGLPKNNKLLADGTVLESEDIQKINKKLLLFLKFNVIPQDLQLVYDEDFPTLENQQFFDVKYLNKTNEAVSWFLKRDLDSWYSQDNFDISDRTSRQEKRIVKHSQIPLEPYFKKFKPKVGTAKTENDYESFFDRDVFYDNMWDKKKNKPRLKKKKQKFLNKLPLAGSTSYEKLVSSKMSNFSEPKIAGSNFLGKFSDYSEVFDNLQVYNKKYKNYNQIGDSASKYSLKSFGLDDLGFFVDTDFYEFLENYKNNNFDYLGEDSFLIDGWDSSEGLFNSSKFGYWSGYSIDEDDIFDEEEDGFFDDFFDYFFDSYDSDFGMLSDFNFNVENTQSSDSYPINLVNQKRKNNEHSFSLKKRLVYGDLDFFENIPDYLVFNDQDVVYNTPSSCEYSGFGLNKIIDDNFWLELGDLSILQEEDYLFDYYFSTENSFYEDSENFLFSLDKNRADVELTIQNNNPPEELEYSSVYEDLTYKNADEFFDFFFEEMDYALNNSILKKPFKTYDYFDGIDPYYTGSTNKNNFLNKFEFFNDFDILRENTNDDISFNRFFSKLVDFRVGSFDNISASGSEIAVSEELSAVKQSQKRLDGASKDVEINRLVRDAEPWSILEDGSIEDFLIPGNQDNYSSQFSLNSNLLDSLNYSVAGGSSVFGLLSDSFSSDSSTRERSIRALHLLSVESDELKSPWLSSEMKISKKNNYFDLVIKNNYDSLLLDSLIESKIGIDWKKKDHFNEESSGVLLKKKMFSISTDNTRLSSENLTKNINFDNKSYKEKIDFNKILRAVSAKSDETQDSDKKTMPIFFFGKKNKKFLGNLDFIIKKASWYSQNILKSEKQDTELLLSKIKDSFGVGNCSVFFYKKNDSLVFSDTPVDEIFLNSDNKTMIRFDLLSGDFFTINKPSAKPGVFLHYDFSENKYVFSKSKFFYKLGDDVFQSNLYFNKSIGISSLFGKVEPTSFVKNKINTIVLKRDVDFLNKTLSSGSLSDMSLGFFNPDCKDIFKKKIINVVNFDFLSKKTTKPHSVKNKSDLLTEGSRSSSDLSSFSENDYYFGESFLDLESYSYPFIHITRDNFEIPSTSPTFYVANGSPVLGNTTKVLVFDVNGLLLDVISEAGSYLDYNEFNLPEIFDGSVFSDSSLELGDNFYEYYKKLIKYYKLRKNFKLAEFKNTHITSDPRSDFGEKETLGEDLSNKVPLMFKNEEFLKKMSNMFPESPRSGKYDNFLGLWPNYRPRPLPMPEVSSGYSLSRLFSGRKNLPINRKVSGFRFLGGSFQKNQNEFLSRLAPGVSFGENLDLFYNKDDTFRYLPEVEHLWGLKTFKNLSEFDITPYNITEQFWNEENISKKFQVIPSYKHKSKNGFVFFDRTAVDTVIKPILSLEDSPEHNYHDTKYYWWDTQNSYFSDFEDIYREDMPIDFWSQSALGEYWNLMVKRESRDIISKLKNTPDQLFKYDWARGSLYTKLIVNLSDKHANYGFTDINRLFDDSSKPAKIYGVLDPSYIEQQDTHREEKSYRDWRFDGLDYEMEEDGWDRVGMTSRPNHNLLHINYDDVLFEEFKWLDTDPETTDYIRERPIDMTSSFDFGDELPEIQQKFRESVDFGLDLDGVSKYILGLDDLMFFDKYFDNKFDFKQSTDKFRKYKETFKLEIEEESVLFSDKRYNINPLADSLKNNDKGTYFTEPMFAISEDNNSDISLPSQDTNQDLNLIDYEKNTTQLSSKFLENKTNQINLEYGRSEGGLSNQTQDFGVSDYREPDDYDFFLSSDGIYDSVSEDELDDIEESFDSEMLELPDTEDEVEFEDAGYYDHFESIFEEDGVDDLSDFEENSYLDDNKTLQSTEYEEIDYDNWYLSTLDHNFDMDTENFDSLYGSNRSMSHVFLDSEVEDSFRNSSEDGFEFSDSPYDNYTIYDSNMNYRNYRTSFWVDDRFSKLYENPTWRTPISYPLGWKETAGSLNNSKSNKSLGIYDIDNFNKKKILYSNKTEILTGDNLELLNSNEISKLKKKQYLFEYSDDDDDIDITDYFSWNLEKSGKSGISEINRSSGGDKLRLDSEEKYLNKSLDYKNYFENYKNFNTKDTYWDEDLNDLDIYSLSDSDYEDSTQLTNYGDAFEKYNISNYSKTKNKKEKIETSNFDKHLEFPNRKFTDIVFDNLGDMVLDQRESKFRIFEEEVTNPFTKNGNFFEEDPILVSENKSFLDTWGPSFVQKQFDFWDNSKYDFDEMEYIYLEEYARDDFVFDDIRTVASQDVLPDSEFGSTFENYGGKNPSTVSSISSKTDKSPYKNQSDSVSDRYLFTSAEQDTNIKYSDSTTETKQLPNLNLVDFFFRSKNDVFLKLSDEFGQNARWAVRNNINFDSNSNILQGNFGLNESLTFKSRTNTDKFNLISFKLSNYSEIDDNSDDLFKKGSVEVFGESDYVIFKFNLGFLEKNFIDSLKIQFLSLYESILAHAGIIIDYFFSMSYFWNFGFFEWFFWYFFDVYFLPKSKKLKETWWGRHMRKHPYLVFHGWGLSNVLTFGFIDDKHLDSTKMVDLCGDMKKHRDLIAENRLWINLPRDLNKWTKDAWKNDNRTYSVLLDDLPQFHFENFKINSKFGSPSKNSIKSNNNFLFKDNVVLGSDYWEYFGLRSSYLQKFNDNYDITTTSDYNYSNTSLDDNSWLLSKPTNNINQSFDNFKNIENSFYINFNNNSYRFRNYNNMVKFFINSNSDFFLKNKYSRLLESSDYFGDFYKDFEMQADSVSDSVVESFDQDLDSHFEGINSFNIDRFSNNSTIEFGNFTNKKYGFKNNYFDLVSVNNDNLNNSYNFYLKNITELSKHGLDNSFLINPPNQNQYFNLLNKDFESKLDFSDSCSYMTNALRSKIVPNQLNSFFGSFWVVGNEGKVDFLKKNNEIYEKKLITKKNYVIAQPGILGYAIKENSDFEANSEFKDNFKQTKSTFSENLSKFELNFLENNYDCKNKFFFDLKSKKTNNNYKEYTIGNKKLPNLFWISKKKKDYPNLEIYWSPGKPFSENPLKNEKMFERYWMPSALDISQTPETMYSEDTIFYEDFNKTNADYSSMFDLDGSESNSTRFWSDLELTSLAYDNSKIKTDLLGSNKFKFFLNYSRNIKSSVVANKRNFDLFKKKKYDWLSNSPRTENKMNDLGGMLSFFDDDLEKKKLEKFIQRPDSYKRLGGVGKYPMFNLLLKTLKYLNTNYWAPDIIPNFRKNQLFRGLGFIPEQYIYKDYKNLNSDPFYKKRLEDYYYRSSDLKFLFNMAYPISGQMPIENLNLLDKHMFGSGLDRFSKLKTLGSGPGFSYNGFKFDNAAFETQKTPYNNLMPFYLTNRNFKFMRLISDGLVYGNSDFSKIMRSGVDFEYSLYPYFNLVGMGLGQDFSNQFEPVNLKNAGDFDVVSDYFLKKKVEAVSNLLGNFKNSGPSRFSTSEVFDDFYFKSGFKRDFRNFKFFGNFFKHYDYDFFTSQKKNNDFLGFSANGSMSFFRVRNYFELFYELKKKNFNNLSGVLVESIVNSNRPKKEDFTPEDLFANSYSIPIDPIDENVIDVSKDNFIFFESSAWSPYWLVEDFKNVESDTLESSVELNHYTKGLFGSLPKTSKLLVSFSKKDIYVDGGELQLTANLGKVHFNYLVSYLVDSFLTFLSNLETECGVFGNDVFLFYWKLYSKICEIYLSAHFENYDALLREVNYTLAKKSLKFGSNRNSLGIFLNFDFFLKFIYRTFGLAPILEDGVFDYNGSKDDVTSFGDSSVKNNVIFEKKEILMVPILEKKLEFLGTPKVFKSRKLPHIVEVSYFENIDNFLKEKTTPFSDYGFFLSSEVNDFMFTKKTGKMEVFEVSSYNYSNLNSQEYSKMCNLVFGFFFEDTKKKIKKPNNCAIFFKYFKNSSAFFNCDLVFNFSKNNNKINTFTTFEKPGYKLLSSAAFLYSYFSKSEYFFLNVFSTFYENLIYFFYIINYKIRAIKKKNTPF